MGKVAKRIKPALEQATREVEAVNTALRAGFPAQPKSRERGAVREAAERLGVQRGEFAARVGTPAKRGRWQSRYGLAPQWGLYQAPVEAAAPVQAAPDRRVTLLQDKVNQLTKALRDAHREANTEDVLRDVIGAIANTPAEPPAWVHETPERERGKPTPEVPVTIWSDLHFGETVEPAEVNGFNAYNMAIAEERMQRLVENTIKLCRHNHTGIYTGAVVNLLGDNVSGGLHPELKATDEEEVIPAAIKAIDWLEAALRRMLGEFGRVYVPCTAGNHGRHTAKPEFKRYYKKNFDWLIYQMLRTRFRDEPRVHFDIRPSNDVFYRVFHERYLAQHGDMLGVKGGDGIIGAIGPIMRGSFKKAGQAGAIGLHFDKLLVGHYHQRLWLPRAIVNNTLKGFDEFAKNALGAVPDRPTQALWFVHPSHGQTAHWDVYVDEKPEPASDWVAVQGVVE